ncbi:hypothetical protein HFD88_000780 [Aspergillus terreus]|nr:hypothetical protein HFD88_000780 [Aspergillus terreus]
MPSFKLLLVIFVLFSLYTQTSLAEVANPTTTSVAPADNSSGAPAPLYPTGDDIPIGNDDEGSIDDAVNDNTVDDENGDADLNVSADPADPDTLFDDDQGRKKMCRGRCRRIGGNKVCHCTQNGFGSCKCRIAHAPCRCIVR